MVSAQTAQTAVVSGSVAQGTTVVSTVAEASVAETAVAVAQAAVDSALLGGLDVIGTVDGSDGEDQAQSNLECLEGENDIFV